MLPDSPYGITRGLNSPGATLSSNVVDWAAQLGATWFRIQVPIKLIWTSQGASPSNWNWNQLDSAVALLQQAGFYIVFPLKFMPTWALQTPAQQATRSSDGLGNYFLPDPTLSAQAAQAVAQRYNGQQNCVSNGTNYGKLLIHAYEVGNEDYNIGVSPTTTSGGAPVFGIHNSPYSIYNGLNGVSGGVQPTRDPHFYVPVAKACYPVLKQYNPGCIVGMAAILWKLRPNYTDFMTGVYSEGGGPYFDYANFHYYSQSADPITGATGGAGNFPDAWGDINKIMAANGDAQKPIWLTEFGWPVPSFVSASTQAAYYKELLDNARTSGVVDKVFAYTIQDSKTSIDETTLVYWGYGQPSATSYVFMPAYGTVQTYINKYPTWSNTPGPPPPQGSENVCLILMENRAYSEVINTKPGNVWKNVNQFAQTYLLLENFFGILHPSLPNYLGLVSGSRQGVGNDNPPSQNGPFSGDTIVDALVNAGISAKTYFENLPTNPSVDSGNYVVRHNPFVYFKNFMKNNVGLLTKCTYNQSNPTASNLIADLSSANPPHFVWLTPNVINNGHTGTDLQADTFLGSLIPAIQATPWYTHGNGIIVLVWDESITSDKAGIGDANPGGGATPCIVISEVVRGVSPFTGNINHYGLLRALCLLYGITPLGNAAHTTNGDITSLLGGTSVEKSLGTVTRAIFRISGNGSTHLLGGNLRAKFRVLLALETDPASMFLLNYIPQAWPIDVFLQGVDGVIPMKGVDGVLTLSGVDGTVILEGVDGAIALNGLSGVNPTPPAIPTEDDS